MNRRTLPFTLACLALAAAPALAAPKDKPAPRVLDVSPPDVRTDPSVRLDYDIVYVRAPRHGDEKRTKWADFSDPTRMEPGADLVVLRPDGSEDVLVSGADGSVMDPYVSFDGEWVFYAKFIDAKHSGADIHKIHVKSRRTVRLTDQTITPNTGAADWSADLRTPAKGKAHVPYGVFNLGPCPVPGGKVAFTSNRNAHAPPRGYPRITLQLFLMDDDGRNVEQTGWMNVACALHPVILKDGRLLFSTLESHAAHNAILWAIWSIHPDGTNWNPLVSGFATGGAPSGFHFQSQLSDETLIVEEYYNLNNSGFGTYLALPPRPPGGAPAFGPADLKDPRNARQPYGGRSFQMPFSPTGAQVLTRFAHGSDGPSPSSIPGEQVKSRGHGGKDVPHATGKVTHPCGAPDNHLLTCWTPGPANHQYNYYPLIDGGIYLIKDGKPVDEPGQMRLIKNDPRYNEQWPRALVPYERVYGVKEPARLVHANDGSRSPHLPEGTPFGLVGTSSLYKRETAPGGVIPPGSVTAVRGPDERSRSLNWGLQGADAGVYDNADVHAIRIVAQEPRTDLRGGGSASPLYGNHAMERLRILGEIPVRKFDQDGRQTPDPDGNPDTSFLAKIPADQPFTFQTLDKDGMVLNMAQTWHQVRPGEVRNNCGGCHAHSQQPTPFERTLASRPDYKLFDLTTSVPLLTDKANDASGKRWDKEDATGLRYEPAPVVNVEYWRDVRPILDRSCVACHTHTSDKPAGGLVLDDDDRAARLESAFGHDSGPSVKVPATYYRLAGYHQGRDRTGIGHDSATRYVYKFQSRRSPLVWKIHGRRTDGASNDDRPSLVDRDDLKSLRIRGERVAKLDYDDAQKLRYHLRDHGDLDYTGDPMPPPEAIAGTYKGPDGKAVKVPPLSDEDRRTIVRWIDLGCPIDLDPRYDPARGATRSFGWMGDDQRPTLAVTLPRAVGVDGPVSRVLIGMYDAYTGLDARSLSVTADFPLDGAAPGEELAGRFKPTASPGVWALTPARPIELVRRGTLAVSVKDRQGNVTRVERTFTVNPATAAR